MTQPPPRTCPDCQRIGTFRQRKDRYMFLCCGRIWWPAEACKKMGIKYIGIEIDRQWIDMGLKRLTQEFLAI